MFKINDDKSIHLTRGDMANITVSAKLKDGTQYTFQPGDVVRIKVFKRRDCGCVEIQKDTLVQEETTEVTLHLEGTETKIGGIISKPANYWYEVEVNPDTAPQTIIGYDDEGEKLFVLYPEGSDMQ
jgi:protein involved in polysaccharide export with SLBB domain